MLPFLRYQPMAQVPFSHHHVIVSSRLSMVFYPSLIHFLWFSLYYYDRHFGRFLEFFTTSCELYSLGFYLFYFSTCLVYPFIFIFSLFYWSVTCVLFSCCILGGLSYILKFSVTGSGYVSSKGQKRKKKKNYSDLCHCHMGSGRKMN
ncbi:hypothetical protein BDV24DRAFT_134149 [Aspergillus arachidicola]|uniref:Uncharacterized protein n=1 Tax=Aspergillus arachidicola TaxID=656916 RepID=A0A5N6Y4B4_9EURO|nr:hypothetical protein BDV24DRAFT_134149 [Aspergillus arachidicola]